LADLQAASIPSDHDVWSERGTSFLYQEKSEEPVNKAVSIAFSSMLLGAVASGLVIGSGSAQSEEPFKADLDKLRESLTKYQDVYTAVREGYFSTVGCVYYNGEKMEGHMEYPKGAMGIHFINTALIGPTPDPMRPPILIYEPSGKELRLVAVEWFVPLATGVKKRPELFGQQFQGPMEGHVPLLPLDFTHWDLHAWLFKENPLGVFAPTNPDVKCDGYDFSLLEHPTKLVPEPQ
jgi:hypothetical protein